MGKYIYLLSFIILMTSCSPKVIEVIDFEQRDLDTLFIEAPKPSALKSAEDFKLPRYNASYHRKHDLLHTRLDLRFDWAKEQVIGQAELQFTPLFYPQKRVTIDAKNFELKSVKNLEGEVLDYDYDGAIIDVNLAKTYLPKDIISVVIEYTANPKASGGSNAITSNQGLFFVNPKGEEGNKPQQIWTQGETEWNSRWFPTIDKPNERCTQELRLTVEDRFKTLSNGLLKNSVNNDDGKHNINGQFQAIQLAQILEKTAFELRVYSRRKNQRFAPRLR